MDYVSIIVALISAVATIGAVVITSRSTRDQLTQQIEIRLAVTDTKLAELDKRVEKHNNLVERTYKLENDLATAFVRIDQIKEDIAEVKHEIK